VESGANVWAEGRDGYTRKQSKHYTQDLQTDKEAHRGVPLKKYTRFDAELSVLECTSSSEDLRYGFCLVLEARL